MSKHCKGKITWKGGTMLYPLPAVMVTCGSYKKNDYNIITVAWTGIVSTDPPRCYISVRKERHSFDLLKKYRNFGINLTTKSLASQTDWCGVRSGRDYKKFTEMNLTPFKADNISAPLIYESPVNLECRVFSVKNLGTHHMFLADILSVHASEEYYDPETEKFDLEKSGLICYSHGHYYEVGKHAGNFGFSVKKK